jgi:hypothetical protein
MRKHAPPRQASPDDPMFGETIIFSVSDPPPRIGVAAAALDVGDCVTIDGVTGDVTGVCSTGDYVHVALSESRFVLAADDRVNLHLEGDRR